MGEVWGVKQILAIGGIPTKNGTVAANEMAVYGVAETSRGTIAGEKSAVTEGQPEPSVSHLLN